MDGRYIEINNQKNISNLMFDINLLFFYLLFSFLMN